LPETLKRLKKKNLFTEINTPAREAEDQDALSSQLQAMFHGLHLHQKIPPHVPLDITEALSLIDHGLNNGHHFIRGKSLDDLRGLRKLLERATLEILRGSGQYSSLEQEALDQFTDWILSFRSGGHSTKIGVITTNYDNSVETGLFGNYLDEDGYANEIKVAKDFDFGFNWRSPFEEDLIHLRPVNPAWTIYKLHGSVTWLRCPLCSHIYVNVTGNIVFHAFRDEIDDANTCDCGFAPLEAHIVAPSIVREIRDSNLLDIWKNAQEVLRRASRWYIIGYSFPSEDLAIRSMFLRAYHSRVKKPEIVVIQHDDVAKARYKFFFPECKYVTGGLLNYRGKGGSRRQSRMTKPRALMS
jgi:hypothetical protein